MIGCRDLLSGNAGCIRLLAAAKPNCFLKQHIDCVAVSGNCQMAIRIDPMYDRVTESLGQPGLIAIDQYDSISVGRLKIITSVPVEPEAINTHDCVNADTFQSHGQFDQ